MNLREIQHGATENTEKKGRGIETAEDGEDAEAGEREEAIGGAAQGWKNGCPLGRSASIHVANVDFAVVVNALPVQNCSPRDGLQEY